jgi:hypothetical protein
MQELREQIILKPFFQLGYYFGMSWETYLDFPVPYRGWLLEQINTEITKAVQAGGDIPTKAPHDNMPDVRAMTGKFRQVGTTSPRHQRFT